MAHPPGNGAPDGVRGIYRVVVRAPGAPAVAAGVLTDLLDLPEPPVYENAVAAVRGAAAVLPSGSELLLVEPFGDDGLLTSLLEGTQPGELVLVILEVADVDRAVLALRERGAGVAEPVPTGRGRRMALVDPASTTGIPLALIQLPSP